jgi:hypothetical protein
MATKRKVFCIEAHKPDYFHERADEISRRCGFTYKQAETAARRALMVRKTSVVHIRPEGGEWAPFVAHCFRDQGGRVQCRSTASRRIANYRLADMVEGDPMAFLRTKES